MARASMPLHTAKDQLAEARDRFSRRRAGRPERRAQAHPRVLVAVPAVERRRRPHRAGLPARPRPGIQPDPDGRSGAAAPARAARRPADQHHPDRRGRPGADQDDRGPRPRARTSTASSWRPASATPRSTSAPTASAPRWKAAGPAHVFGHEHYAEHLEDLGLRRGADPRPGLRQDGRRGRPDLLAQGRRPAADRAGQDAPPTRSPRPCWPTAAAGTSAAAGVPARLPAHRRDRACARQRRRHDERPRPPGARPRRPGRAARPRHRGAGQRSTRAR